MVEESIECDICNSYNHSPFLSTSGYDTKYNLVECKDCGLVFMSPRPHIPEIRKYYEELYFKQHLGSNIPPKDYIKKTEKRDGRRLKFMTANKLNFTNKKLLDVGSGCGTFLKSIKKKRLALALGLEPNKSFAEYAKHNYKVNIEIMHFDDFKFNQKFDIICLWQVLNMVPNPSYLLTKLQQILKKEGTLFIEVPNYLNAPKFPWKKRVYPEDPAQFFYFTKDTLVKILKKFNLKIVKIKYAEKMGWMMLSVKHA